MAVTMLAVRSYTAEKKRDGRGWLPPQQLIGMLREPLTHVQMEGHGLRPETQGFTHAITIDGHLYSPSPAALVYRASVSCAALTAHTAKACDPGTFPKRTEIEPRDSFRGLVCTMIRPKRSLAEGAYFIYYTSFGCYI
jgi:hypothetical protein